MGVYTRDPWWIYVREALIVSTTVTVSSVSLDFEF